MRVIGVIGRKNTGKTRLVSGLVRYFDQVGMSVSTVKHTHHLVPLDQSGTDSDQHRMAGAQEVILATPEGWRLVHNHMHKPPLETLLSRLAPVDLVIVEGFKHAELPKIETWRKAASEAPLAQTMPAIKALVSPDVANVEMPQFHPDAFEAIASFIMDQALR